MARSIDVFGQSPGIYLHFRTVKSQRSANLWVRWYSFLGYRSCFGSRLFFDSAPTGEGWI